MPLEHRRYCPPVAYSDSDFRDLVEALRKYVNEDMDQWDYFQFTTAFGNKAYVSIRLAPEPDVPAEAYRSLD